MNATVTTQPKVMKLLEFMPLRRLPAGGEKYDANARPDAVAAFAQRLHDRANTPFHFKPLRNRRYFGINE